MILTVYGSAVESLELVAAEESLLELLQPPSADKTRLVDKSKDKLRFRAFFIFVLSFSIFASRR